MHTPTQAYLQEPRPFPDFSIRKLASGLWWILEGHKDGIDVDNLCLQEGYSKAGESG